jgi:hypothetical protein
MADECEYCGGIAEYEVVSDGNYVKVCKTCLNDDMVILQKPSNQQVEWSYKRPTVKQILSRLSGVRGVPEKPQANAPNLSALRQPKTDNAMKLRLTSMKADSPDQRSDLVKKREPQPPSTAAEAKANKEDIEEEDFLDI